MAWPEREPEPARALTSSPPQRANGSDHRLDWFAAATGVWAIGGAWLDAWSHHATEVESFFTPAHAVLYTGLLAMAAVVLAGSTITRRGWRLAFRQPPGYGPALIGIPIFLVAGIGDGVWHTLLGIEEDLDALLSPTHLVLGAGGGLMASGPLLAAWHRARHWPAGVRPGLDLPAAVSLGLLVSIVSFFTAFANPIALPLAAGTAAGQLAVLGVESGVGLDIASGLLGQALGVASILLLAATVMAAVLSLVAPWRLRFGSVTLLFAIGLGTSALPHESLVFLPGIVVAGLAADISIRVLRPTLDRAGALALFSFLVPAVLSALYLATIAVTVGIAWPVELWTGSIVLAGGVGLGLAAMALAIARPIGVARASGAWGGPEVGDEPAPTLL